MGLKPISNVLQSLLSQPAWEHQRRFALILQHWPKIVPKKAQHNAKPIQIVEDVLWIATSSSTWSQHLTLQRQRYLQSLNQHLPTPLTNLRFSPVHWERKPAYSPLADLPDSKNPSALPNHLATKNQNKPRSAVDAVKVWAEHQQAKLLDSPYCPSCGRRTPAGELARWGICCCCMVDKLQVEQTNSNIVTPNEHKDISSSFGNLPEL